MQVNSVNQLPSLQVGLVSWLANNWLASWMLNSQILGNQVIKYGLRYQGVCNAPLLLAHGYWLLTSIFPHEIRFTRY